jgi:hypothetical protein
MIEENDDAVLDDVQNVNIVEIPPETLRETVEKNFDQVSEEAELSPDEKSERLRDDKGRFAKSEESESEPLLEDTSVLADTDGLDIETSSVPKSWGKEYYEGWDKLDPRMQEYINQREYDYHFGVSAYKTEVDRMQPLANAIAPFSAELEANNINPADWISQLGNAHKLLATGQPTEKLSMFLKLANDYQVPIDQLFTQQDGKVYINPQVPDYQPAAPQAHDIENLVENKFVEYQTQQEYDKFLNSVEEHPHFETVKLTMAQLLEAGLADDLDSAYEAALRHPRHADVFDQMLSQSRKEKETAKQEKQKAIAKNARQNAVSPPSATPKGQAPTGKTGLRDVINEAFDEHANAGIV